MLEKAEESKENDSSSNNRINSTLGGDTIEGIGKGKDIQRFINLETLTIDMMV